MEGGIEVRTLPVGELGTNCYIVWQGTDCALIDCGDDFPRIEAALAGLGRTPGAILLTHGHFDHIGAAASAREKYGAPVIIGRGDVPLLCDPRKSLAPTGDARYVFAPDRAVGEGDTVEVGALSFGVLETPGHTPGGVCYLLGDKLFCGDTLFCGSCGRTDFWGGDAGALAASLRRLAGLGAQIAVYPGHGGTTTIAAERRQNPYLGVAEYDDLY